MKLNVLFYEISYIDSYSEDSRDIVSKFKSYIKRSLSENDRVTFNTLMKMIIYTRDIHGGKGHCDLTYELLHVVMINLYSKKNSNILYENIYFDMFKNIMNEGIGCWKDMKRYVKYIVNLSESNKYKKFYEKHDIKNIIRDHVQNIIVPQLVSDRKNHSIGEDFSSCAKWIPREKSKNIIYKNLAKMIATEYTKHVYPIMNNRERYRIYRKLISTLNRYLDTTEIHMCENKWNNIDFQTTPKSALMKYYNAFLKCSDNTISTHRRECGNNFKNYIISNNNDFSYPFSNLTFCDDYKYYIPVFMTDDPECRSVGLQMMTNNIFECGFTHNECAKQIRIDTPMAKINNISSSNQVSICLLYQYILKLITNRGLERFGDKIKIVILTKFTYDKCIKPLLDKYNQQSKGIYPTFFTSMKQLYKSYGVKKIPKIVLWDFNTYYKFPKVDRKYKDNKKINIIYGFKPVLTQYPLETKYIENYDTVNYILNQKRYNDIF
tara:strand:+ start:181 stop:1656 length:1476 start_codon:yes stop_codon:yes gene_type:complete